MNKPYPTTYSRYPTTYPSYPTTYPNYPTNDKYVVGFYDMPPVI